MDELELTENGLVDDFVMPLLEGFIGEDFVNNEKKVSNYSQTPFWAKKG